jgi:hypothetical protein
MISAETPVEELVVRYPDAIGFLIEHGIVCLVCGEAFWGTLGELMAQKRIPDPETVLAELRAFLKEQSEDCPPA